MAAPTGKRKRDDSDDGSEDEGAVRARFQRAFEAKFKPLDVRKPSPSPELIVDDIEDDEDEEDLETSDWEGLSDDDGAVEVVELAVFPSHDASAIEREKKAFMVSSMSTPTICFLTLVTVIKTTHSGGQCSTATGDNQGSGRRRHRGEGKPTARPRATTSAKGVTSPRS